MIHKLTPSSKSTAERERTARLNQLDAFCVDCISFGRSVVSLGKIAVSPALKAYVWQRYHQDRLNAQTLLDELPAIRSPRMKDFLLDIDYIRLNNARVIKGMRTAAYDLHDRSLLPDFPASVRQQTGLNFNPSGFRHVAYFLHIAERVLSHYPARPAPMAWDIAENANEIFYAAGLPQSLKPQRAAAKPILTVRPKPSPR